MNKNMDGRLGQDKMGLKSYTTLHCAIITIQTRGEQAFLGVNQEIGPVMHQTN